MTTDNGARSAADLLELAQGLVEKAKKKGADQAEVFAEHGRQVAVSLEQNDIKGTSIDTHQAVGLRVFLQDRVGFAYANRLDEQGLDGAVDDALAIAKTAPGDEANGLVPAEEAAEVAGLHDEALADLPPDEVVDRSARMLKTALDADERIRADGAVSVTTFDYALASSAGTAAKATETVGSYGLFGMAVDGENVGSFDHEFRGVRTVGDLQEEPLARRFADKVVSLLEPVSGRSYKGKVLFSNEAFEDIFLDALLQGVNGDRVHKGKSRLKEKLGKKIAVDKLTVVDDGTLPGRLGSGAFDREGVPHRRTPLIEDGVLQGFLYDGKAARRAKTKSTGHAQGSARGLPSIGTTNLDVKAGKVTDKELLDELHEGLLVTRFAGRVDGVSGDFSGVAKCSYLVEGGERTRAVKETLIAGNAFDLLEKIVALGSVQHENMSTRCPWVLVDGVDVTAGAA